MNKLLLHCYHFIKQLTLKRILGEHSLLNARIGFLCLTLCLVICSGCQRQPNAYDSSGKPIYFADYRGQWIVLNYWASWCKPCWQEIPELNKFYNANSHKHVVVFGVNYDGESPEKLPDLIQKMQIQFPTLMQDPKDYFGIEHVTGLPTTIIIDPQGKVVKVLLGEQTEQSLQKAIGLV